MAGRDRVDPLERVDGELELHETPVDSRDPGPVAPDFLNSLGYGPSSRHDAPHDRCQAEFGR